jgi:hypothetical protein
VTCRPVARERIDKHVSVEIDSWKLTRHRTNFHGYKFSTNSFFETNALEVVHIRLKSFIVWGYNWATLFLENINTGTLYLQVGGRLESETAKCGQESCGTLTWERLRCRGPAAIVNDRLILSSERMLHKDYNRKCSMFACILCRGNVFTEPLSSIERRDTIQTHRLIGGTPLRWVSWYTYQIL